jgi:hypothetical protein
MGWKDRLLLQRHHAKKGPAAMIAPFPATSSRTSRPASEPTADAATSRAADWGARCVQIGLALYLLPVLVVIFMIGGFGIAILGLAVLAARMMRWSQRVRGVDEQDDVLQL